MNNKERLPSNLNSVITVTGVSGAGKDFLLENIVQNEGRDLHGISIVNFGDCLFEILKTKHNLNSKDEIKINLTQEQVMAGVREAINEILSRMPVVLNGHIVYKQGQNLISNPEIEYLVRPQTYIFIQADPDDIVLWRRNDTSRQRAVESSQDIATHQAIAESVAKSFAVHLGSRYILLINNPNNIQENTEILFDEILRLRKSLTNE